MEYNLNTNNSNLSFGRMHCVSGGKSLLKRKLNAKERVELQNLIDSQKDNNVRIYLAEHTHNRLEGWTVFYEKGSDVSHRKDYTQMPLFGSPLKFIKRLCKKADALNEKYSGDIKEISDKSSELNHL